MTQPVVEISHRPLFGALAMLSALAILPGMDAIAKYLSGHLPTLEIVWARFTFYLLSMAPVAFWHVRARVLHPARPGLQLVRGLLMAGSAYGFFLAIRYMPLADTMAVFFIYPLLILVASALLLGEAIGKLRWAMVCLGFIGALLVIRPGLHGVSPGVPFALLGGVAYAAALMCTRKLAAHDPGLVTGLISALVGAILYSAAVPFDWQTPSGFDWLLMVSLGILAGIGHFMLITAHRMATAAQLAPLGYAEIVSAIFFGLVVFGDWPAPIVWVGILVIVASGVIVTWSNSRIDVEGP
jgi:drug/metabolite transporter (DMT)-like permease